MNGTGSSNLTDHQNHVGRDDVTTSQFGANPSDIFKYQERGINK